METLLLAAKGMSSAAFPCALGSLARARLRCPPWENTTAALAALLVFLDAAELVARSPAAGSTVLELFVRPRKAASAIDLHRVVCGTRPDCTRAIAPLPRMRRRPCVA